MLHLLRSTKVKMAHLTRKVPVKLLWFSFLTTLIKALDMSHWAYLQVTGDLNTGCLHKLTLNNSVTDTIFSTKEEHTFLMEFYEKTGGPYWRNRTGWGDNNTHHCHWAGIQCYPNNTYVKWIDMTFNNLTGTPRNLWKFRNLQGICMSRNNGMTGTLSDIIYKNMTRLRRLCVSFASLHGEVPWDVILQLENLEKLQICCMAGKKLRGELPSDIGKLHKLQVFSIGENDIWGDLPISISDLTKLWFLDLEYVKLYSGSLSYFSNMTNLTNLHMTNCNLKGIFPQDFGITHPYLKELDLLGNRLGGQLTDRSFKGLNKLQRITLCRNKFQGLLPKTLGTLESLKVLDLSHNNFTGLQENMTFNPQLETLELSDNRHFNHDVKDLIRALEPSKDSLRILIANECALKGELPQTLWDFSMMTYLDLSANSLSGHIPVPTANSLLFLFHINLASNSFTGSLDAMSFFPPLRALTYMNITGNPSLHSKQAFQTYLKPNYQFVQRNTNYGYSCPSVEMTSTHGIIDMDASYYYHSLCFCNSGFYGYHNFCLPCMDGGTCDVEALPLVTGGNSGSTEDDSATGVKMTIKKGYWPCDNGTDGVHRLVRCSKKESFEKEVCNPSGKCQCTLEVTAEGRLKTSCNSSCLCRDGSTGRFCSKCISGYYKRGNICVECPEFRKNFPVVMTVCFVVCFLVSVVSLTCFRSYKRISLLVLFVLVIALTILYLNSVIPGWFFIIIFAVWIVGLSGEADNLQSFICIAVFFFQSLDAMLCEAKVWPETILFMKYEITNVFNFEFAQLTCSFSGVERPEIAHAILLFLPLGGIVCVWLIYVLSKVIECRHVSSSICKRVTIQVLLLVYFPLTTKTLSSLSPCVHQYGLSYLKEAHWLDCNGSSYNWLKTLGYTSLVGFVIAVPLFVFMPLLLKNLNADGQPVSQETDSWLKPLYEEFQLKYRRYFPLIFLARRLVLAVLLSLVPSTSCYQILGITVLFIAFIIITLITKPYAQYSDKFEFENMADVVISVDLLLSFVGLASIRNSSHVDNSLVWLIICINLVIVFFCAGGILVLFVINLCRSQPENNVQYEPIPG